MERAETGDVYVDATGIDLAAPILGRHVRLHQTRENKKAEANDVANRQTRKITKERNIMTQEIEKRSSGPLDRVKSYLANVDIEKRLDDMLGENAKAFANSVINVVGGNKQLRDIAISNPDSIMRSVMKAASVNLPIDPALGQAAIVPYGKEAVFQIMYRGVIQLCIRSGQYKTINCSEIYADEIKSHNPITGEIVFNDPETYKMRYQDDRDKHVVGHYLYFKLLTGFEKSGYISHKEVMSHAKKYSKAYQYDLKSGKGTSAWSTDPIAMGNKTIILRELKRYGVMSIPMQVAIVAERETFEEAQANATKRIEAEQGSEPIDTTFEANGDDALEDEPEDPKTKAKAAKEKKKLADAAKKAEAELAARSKRQKKDKDAVPPYHCNGCGKGMMPDELKENNGAQCPHCLSKNLSRNDEKGTPWDDPPQVAE